MCRSEEKKAGPTATLGAWVSDYRFSESNHRQFYRRWSELMQAAGWSAVVPSHPATHAIQTTEQSDMAGFYPRVSA